MRGSKRMTDYLVFLLYGPLSAWGDAAGIEIRPVNNRPGKSAIIGLLSCALGWRRDNQKEIDLLAASYQLATKTVTPGKPLTDYHTIQHPKRKRGYRSRRDEVRIEGKDMKTTLSWRDYYCDAVHIAALRPQTDAQPAIHEICDHLRCPRGILYLGRRSCPPALPLNPKVLAAGGFREALDTVTKDEIVNAIGLAPRSQWRLFNAASIRYAWEGHAGDLEAQEIVIRRDNPGSRTQHLFQTRREHVTTIEGEG